MSKRVAAFFYSPVPKPGFTAVPVGDRLGYVRGVLTPKGTSLIAALGWVHEGDCKNGTARYPADECFMNSHYARGRKCA